MKTRIDGQVVITAESSMVVAARDPALLGGPGLDRAESTPADSMSTSGQQDPSRSQHPYISYASALRLSWAPAARAFGWVARGAQL